MKVNYLTNNNIVIQIVYLTICITIVYNLSWSGTMNNKFKLPNISEEKSVLKTIRLKIVTLKKIEKLAKKRDISVNRIINECIEYALNNISDEDIK